MAPLSKSLCGALSLQSRGCAELRCSYLALVMMMGSHTPVEIEALAEEIMQDTLFGEADAYHEAVSLFPSLYLAADEWDFYALCRGNDAAAAF